MAKPKKTQSGRAKAKRLHDEIQALIELSKMVKEPDTSHRRRPVSLRDTSPRDFIHKRMQELDRPEKDGA